MNKIQEDIDARRLVANYYLENIRNVKVILPKVLGEKAHVWHLFVIRTLEREKLLRHLKKYGIETLIHYPIPANKQKAYANFNELNFPLTNSIHEEVLSLPISGVMEMESLIKVVEAVNNF